MDKLTATFEGHTVTKNSRRAYTHVAFHTHPQQPGKFVTSWHSTEKAAQRGDSDMRKYGWTVAGVAPVQPA